VDVEISTLRDLAFIKDNPMKEKADKKFTKQW
jgi:hypothetical protein